MEGFLILLIFYNSLDCRTAKKFWKYIYYIFYLVGFPEWHSLSSFLILIMELCPEFECENFGLSINFEKDDVLNGIGTSFPYG